MLAANDVDVMIDAGNDYTPTPVISHAILTYNRGHTRGLADGIVITPSHNPPEDGGFEIQPAPRRTGRHAYHTVDRGEGERASRGTSARV